MMTEATLNWNILNEVITERASRRCLTRCFHAPWRSERPAAPARPARSSCSSRTCATRRTASTSSGRRAARHPAGRATRAAGRSERFCPDPTSPPNTHTTRQQTHVCTTHRKHCRAGGSRKSGCWFPNNRRDADIWDGEEEHLLPGRVYSRSRAGEFRWWLLTRINKTRLTNY